MKRFDSSWLVLLLVSGAACTYKFPDPKDESQVYKCAADGDCASGFSCVDEVCLDQQKYGTQTVTIHGFVRTTPVAAVAYTVVQGIELDTPVRADGSFDLVVPVRDMGDMVSVYSRGAPTGGFDRVQLAIVLGAAGDVQATTAVLTPFTTAAYAAIVAANGGSLPATRDQLKAAQARMTERYTEDELLNAAAAIQVVAASSHRARACSSLRTTRSAGRSPHCSRTRA